MNYESIQRHIEFAEDLVRKYEWPKKTKENFDVQLDRIRSKQKDKALNLSVIGEFSVGKSSFINALLGVDLLVSDVVQGTTLVNTVIEDGPKLSLSIVKKNKSQELLFEFESIGGLREAIIFVTTDESVARMIKFVKVRMPSELLASGIRIIDTPGTDSIESWHEDVTKEALHDLSDLSIVLTYASRQLPETLMNFVGDNLSEIYSKCAFVATYFDMIRQQDRTKVLSFMSHKLKKELGISRPMVFPFSSPAILARNAGESLTANQEEMVAISEDSKNRMLSLMSEKRQISQIQKLTFLTREIYQNLEENMLARERAYDEEYNLLTKSIQAPLDPFISEQRQDRKVAFNSWASSFIKGQNTDLEQRQVQAKSNVLKAIGDYQCDKDELKEFLENEVPKLCVKEAENIAGAVVTVDKALREKYMVEITTFQLAFERKFEELGILKVKLDEMKSKTMIVPKVNDDTISGSVDYVNSEWSDKDLSNMGVYLGAIVGTFIPVIGTIVGGIVGGLLTFLLFHKSIDKIKKEACDRLSEPLDKYFSEVSNKCLEACYKKRDEYLIGLKDEISGYLTAYKEIVDRKIREHDSLVEENRRNKESVTEDLKDIKTRLSQLESMSVSLSRSIES